MSQIFPGPSIDSTQTIQFILSARAPETESEQQATENFSAMVLQAVRDEDYRIGFGIQESILTGANQNFVLAGTNLRFKTTTDPLRGSWQSLAKQLSKTEAE